MKLLAILLFLSIAASAQTKLTGYTSYPNSQTHIPDSVVFTVQPHIRAVKRLTGFHGKTVSDYKHSGYDLGHMADADDLDYSQQSEYDSFNADCNVFPQRASLNRITWLALENFTRELKQPVRVKVSWQGIARHIGRDSIAVPAICVKELWYQGKHEVYAMPNADTVIRHPFTYYKKAG